MTRLQASLLILVLWAGIYLPGLGSTELKGEEGRRILPAVTMLETGNWLVPYVGGEPFLRKPPLVNWAIAASFKITGVRNEWTARLPSALCVLALGLVIVGTSGRGWLKVETALVAALMAMTQSGLLAKARFAGAEIEGIYAPLSGIAIVGWLAWWSRGKSPWLVWVVPGFVLGLASLAKGPSFHLVFFYAIVLTVLGMAKRWRALLHPAHFVSLAVSAGMFAAWAVPYFKTPEAKDAAAVWKRQGIDRFTDSEFNAGNYFLNIPRGLADQLPWLLFAPVLLVALRKGNGGDRSTSEDDKDHGEHGLRGRHGGIENFRNTPPDNPRLPRDPCSPRSIYPIESAEGGASEGVPFLTLRAIAWATAGCFFVVLLIPGTLPRYVLPLGTPIAILLAAALAGVGETSSVLRRWHLTNRGLAALLLLGGIAAPFAVGASQTGGLSFAPVLKAALLCAPLLALAVLVLARRAVGLRPSGLAVASGVVLALSMALYSIAAVPWINRRDDIRPVAAAIDAAVPKGEQLIILDPGYLAAIFYLRTPYRYALSKEEIPAGGAWVLVRGKERKSFAEKRPDLAVAQVISSRRGSELLLLQPSAGIQKLPTR